MKLFLLKILLQRRARDEGFTLPMVIALGLVMLLLGAINITIANEENLTAISQNSRSDALAIAEVGIARYRELLDRNRTLAVYDSDQWATTTTTEVCDDNIGSFVPGVSNDITEAGKDLNNDGDTTDVIGSYSLVSYNYINDNDVDDDATTLPIVNGQLDLSNDAANNNARGILTVKGTAPNNAGEAQIQVEIPIRINPDDMTNLAPALWIGSNTITAGDLGNNLTIGNGNIVIQDLPVTTGTTRDGCRDFSDADTTDGSQDLASTIDFPVPPVTTPPTPPTRQGTVISDSRSIPSIQKIIDDVADARTALGTPLGSPINNLPIVDADGKRIFGTTIDNPYNPDVIPADFNASTHCADIRDCRYYYDPAASTTAYTNVHPETQPDGSVINRNADLLTDGIAKTTLLLNQPLTITATTKNVKVGSTSPNLITNDSDAFEIYVNGNNAIIINADTGRTLTINAFIHAPQSTLTITGEGDVKINGSVWVNNFVNNNTGSVNISPDSIKTSATTSDRAYKFYSTTDRRTPRPLTGSPTNWKTQQVD